MDIKDNLLFSISMHKFTHNTKELLRNQLGNTGRNFGLLARQRLVGRGFLLASRKVKVGEHGDKCNARNGQGDN